MDSVKTYTFRCRIFEAAYAPEPAEVCFQNPVPIYSGLQQLGFANVSIGDNNDVYANCSIVFDCPERLDLENQEALYLLPNVIFERKWPYDGSKSSRMTIRRLEFHSSVEDIGLSKAWEIFQ